jgi:hypothetical protein
MMPSINDLVAMSDAEITADDLKPFLSGRHPSRVEAVRADLKSVFEAALAGLEGDATTRTYGQSIAVLTGRLLAQAVPRHAPHLCPLGEVDAAERHWARTMLSSIRLLREVKALAARKVHPSRWPTLQPIAREEPPPRAMLGQAFDWRAWCETRSDILTDPRRVRVVDGRLRTRGLTPDENATVHSHHRLILGWLDEQFADPARDTGIVIQHSDPA